MRCAVRTSCNTPYNFLSAKARTVIGADEDVGDIISLPQLDSKGTKSMTFKHS
ncbi:hypothetical protein KSZ_61330 [Dictyobacter formicarum]|uniref:Uncharacterized protein n=1 Tax=Dictyobacter formicarum TaxID=2778368 RepID=A0ABQ3VPE5_9CHLR|nr:hypothetical protein KSZ_61330 [Dictyobacter formicarum]